MSEGWGRNVTSNIITGKVAGKKSIEELKIVLIAKCMSFLAFKSVCTE